MNRFVYGRGSGSTTAQDGDDYSSEGSLDENANGESTDSSFEASSIDIREYELGTDSFPSSLASYSRSSSVENEAEHGEGEHDGDSPLQPSEENFTIDVEVLRIIYASFVLWLALLIWLWFMF